MEDGIRPRVDGLSELALTFGVTLSTRCRSHTPLFAAHRANPADNGRTLPCCDCSLQVLGSLARLDRSTPRFLSASPAAVSNLESHSQKKLHSIRSQQFMITLRSTRQTCLTSHYHALIPHLQPPKEHLPLKMSENYVAPGQQRYLRACMVCSIVMTYAVSQPTNRKEFHTCFSSRPN